MNGKKAEKPFLTLIFQTFLLLQQNFLVWYLIPEDLGDPTDPAQQPHEHPFLKECQAANFRGSLDYASMKLNVTQVFCCIYNIACTSFKNFWLTFTF